MWMTGCLNLRTNTLMKIDVLIIVVISYGNKIRGHRTVVTLGSFAVEQI